DSSPFINEGRLRGFTVARASGASESQTSQMLSGLYAMSYMEAKHNNMDDDEAAAHARGIVEGVADQGGILTPTAIAQGTGHSVTDLIAASNLEEAVKFRVTDPLASNTALRQNFALVNSARRATLESIGVDKGRLAQLKGPITMSAMRDSELFSDRELAHASMLFQRQAKAFGVNQFEMDSFLASTYDQQQLNLVNQQLKSSQQIDEILGGRGLTRGFAGLATLVSLRSKVVDGSLKLDADAGIALSDAWNAFTGNMNLSDKDEARLLELEEGAFSIKEGMSTDDVINARAARAGAEIAYKLLQTGRDDKGRTMEQRAKERLAATNKDWESLTPEQQKARIKEEAARERKSVGDILNNGTAAERRQALADLARAEGGDERLKMLDQLEAATSKDLPPDRGHAAIETVQDMLARNPDLSFQQARRRLGQEDRAAMDTLLQDMKDNDEKFADSPLGKAMELNPLDRIVEILERLMDWVSNGMSGAVPPARQDDKA
ncbi:MAG TPA: hypothetical protein VM537_15455, partial [Anaerolineae bacterium]|nr:hypothetical protein [Anaerolineae bacterium]